MRGLMTKPVMNSIQWLLIWTVSRSTKPSYQTATIVDGSPFTNLPVVTVAFVLYYAYHLMQYGHYPSSSFFIVIKRFHSSDSYPQPPHWRAVSSSHIQDNYLGDPQIIPSYPSTVYINTFIDKLMLLYMITI